MMQVIEMTHSEKVEMYQMIEKDRLIEMLIEANNQINRLTEVKNLRIADVSWRSEQLCECKQLRLNYTTDILHCIKCGEPQK
jgi:hypothetical protein